MKKKIMSALLASVMVLGLAACGSGNSNNQPTNAETTVGEKNDNETTVTTSNTSEEKILRMVVTAEPPNMDPQTATDSVSAEISNATLEGLIRVYKGEITPGMAETWEISDDGLTYTFHIRDAKWSDGVPVSAKDFEYSIKRLLNPDTAAQYAYQGFYIKGGQAWNEGKGTEEEVGVKAIDDKTLEIVLESPTSYFLSLLQFTAYLPSRQDIVEKHGQKFAADADKLVYNGPFIMTDWKHEEKIDLVKNEDYWDKENIHLAKAELPIIIDRKTEAFMYDDGQLDYALLNKDTMEQYKAQDLVQYFHDGAAWYFEVNSVHEDPVKNKVLNNKNFKQALGFAIDRQAFVDAVLKNGSEPASRFVLPLVAGPTEGKTYNEEYSLDFYPPKADIEKAKEYLNTSLTELGMTIDQLPTIEYLTDDTEAARVQAEAIQAMIKELGIKFEVKQVPFKQRLDLMDNQKFDLVMAGWGPDYDDPMTYMDLWVTGGGNNQMKWSNTKYDELIFGAKKETDKVKRAEMIFEAEKILLEEAHIVPVFNRRQAYVEQPYISDLEKNFYGATRNFIYTDIDMAKRAEILGK